MGGRVDVCVCVCARVANEAVKVKSETPLCQCKVGFPFSIQSDYVNELDVCGQVCATH